MLCQQYGCGHYGTPADPGTFEHYINSIGPCDICCSTQITLEWKYISGLVAALSVSCESYKHLDVVYFDKLLISKGQIRGYKWAKWHLLGTYG